MNDNDDHDLTGQGQLLIVLIVGFLLALLIRAGGIPALFN